MREFKEKLVAFINALPEDATGGSLNWTKDDVLYSLSFYANGGTINLSYNAYKQSPADPPQAEVPVLAREN